MDVTLDVILWGPRHATIGVRLMRADPVTITPVVWTGLLFSTTSAGLAQASSLTVERKALKH
jgi:hypothetical protein